jgi:cytochrome c5
VNRAVAIAVFVASMLGACARSSPPMATATDAQRGNVELAELEQGRKLLIGKCTACHRVPMPKEHAAAEWPVMLDEMAARSNIDITQQKLIEKYLVTMATK